MNVAVSPQAQPRHAADRLRGRRSLAPQQRRAIRSTGQARRGSGAEFHEPTRRKIQCRRAHRSCCDEREVGGHRGSATTSTGRLKRRGQKRGGRDARLLHPGEEGEACDTCGREQWYPHPKFGLGPFGMGAVVLYLQLLQPFAQPQGTLDFQHQGGVAHQPLLESALLLVRHPSDNVVLHPFEVARHIYHCTTPVTDSMAWLIAAGEASVASSRTLTANVPWPSSSPIAKSVSRSVFHQPRRSASSRNRLRARKITRLKCSCDRCRSLQICSFSSSFR